MDQFLIEYLKSGKAWVLIGAGPSTAMGYPSWGQLAEVAINTAKVEVGEKINGNIDAIMKRKDYPAVFDKIREILHAQTCQKSGYPGFYKGKQAKR